MFTEWVENNDVICSKIATLRDKTLVCFCAPRPCHGDVLAEWAENLDD